MGAVDHSLGLSKKKDIKTIYSEMVDSLCTSIHDEPRIGAIRNIMRDFRSIFDCGDDDNESKLTSMSFPVFQQNIVICIK